MDEGKEPTPIGINAETGQRLFDLEKRLPLDRLEKAFIDEFGQRYPETSQIVRLLREKTLYLDFLDHIHEERRGGTIFLYEDYRSGDISHKIELRVSDDSDQDLHELTHEWIHGLSIGDVGRSWEDGGSKKRVLYGRIGPTRVQGLLTTDASGRKQVEITTMESSPVEVRFWEWLTEWRARKISIKYFPEKFSDFHDSFKTGYAGVSVVEWFEKQAEISGLQSEFLDAVDEGLVDGHDDKMKDILNRMFPGINAYHEILDAISKELMIEKEVKSGKLTSDEAGGQLYDKIYPTLVQRLEDASNPL